MKQRIMYPKLVVTFLLTFFILQVSIAQWQPKGLDLLPDTQRVASISIHSESVVWGVAFYDKTTAPVPSDLIPYVFRTVDGGDEWEVQEIAEAQGRICQDIFAMNDSVAWITTNGLTSDSLRGVFKTIDGGKTWEEKLDGVAGGGMIHFFDDTNGIAIHERFYAHTFDGGESWDGGASPLNALPFDVGESVFYTAANNAFTTIGDTIWFGTTHGRIFRSLNRGFDWDVFSTPFEMENVIQSTAFRNASEGMIVSYARLFQDAIVFEENTVVALTFDGGETWEMADTLFDFKVSCVTGVPDTAHKFLGATNGLSSISAEEGQEWEHFSFRPYNAVEFFSSELGWVGNSQTSEENRAIMYKWEGIVSSNENIAVPNIDLKVFPNPFTQSFNIELSYFDFLKYKNEDLVVEAFDILGKKILTQNILNQKTEITFPSVADGIYFYTIKTSQQILSSGKMLKK